MVDVRVGIVTWNVADEVAACLAALPDALGGLEAEVVVVDNASHDRSSDVASTAGVRVVRSERNLGYARAMNEALRSSDARALIALNPDTVPTPGSLAALVRVLDEHPEAGVAVPRLVSPDGRTEQSVQPFPTLGIAALANLLPASAIPRWLRDRLWLEGSVRPGRSGEVPWATGAVHCIRSSAVDGPVYSERWFMFVEDLELCSRLRREGWRVHLDADAVVVHHGNASGRQAFEGRRTARWWNETYDWLGCTVGGARTRLFAFLNLVGWLRVAVAGAFGRRRDPRREELAVHLRTLIQGPPPPAPPL